MKGWGTVAIGGLALVGCSPYHVGAWELTEASVEAGWATFEVQGGLLRVDGDGYTDLTFSWQFFRGGQGKGSTYTFDVTGLAHERFDQLSFELAGEYVHRSDASVPASIQMDCEPRKPSGLGCDAVIKTVDAVQNPPKPIKAKAVLEFESS